MNEGINLVAVVIADGFGAALSLIMFGARIWARNKNNTEVKLFRMMLMTAFLSCLADIIVFVFDGKPGLLVYILLFIGNTWLFAANVLLGALWIMSVMTHISGKGLPRGQKIFVDVLAAIGVAFLIVNLFTPIVFNISSDNVYARGPLYWLYIFFELLIVSDSIIVYFNYRGKYPEARHFPLWQFIIPILVGSTFQSIAYGISLICPAVSIAICGVVMGLFSENEEEKEILQQNEMKSKIILEQQKQLEEALSMAQSANRSKTTFLNNMSHDIRTPMNAIIGYTGLAKKHLDNKEMLEDYLNKIENSFDYLLSLINEVLDMSRIESGKMTLDEQPESLKEIVDSVVDIIKVDVRAKNHEFSTDIEALQDEFVVCDKLRIKQIFINILSNSIKYTPENGRISLSVTKKQGTASNAAASNTTDSNAAVQGTSIYEFCISDNGIGMDEEYIDTLFEPFTRVKSSTVSGIQGAGLGMAITKNLIDMMGGKIDVKSKPNEGTTILVTFEFKTVTAEDIKPADDNFVRSEIDFDCSGKGVLLVEDNALNLEIATMILEENGLKVDTASDGDIAVEKFKAAEKGTYDFILMDIQMPRVNGYEATRQIRVWESEGERIPIIALTANAFVEDKQLAFDAGMDDFLTKPIRFDELFVKMARFFR